MEYLDVGIRFQAERDVLFFCVSIEEGSGDNAFPCPFLFFRCEAIFFCDHYQGVTQEYKECTIIAQSA